MADARNAFKLFDRTHCREMQATRMATRREAMRWCLASSSCGAIACTFCRSQSRALPKGSDQPCRGNWHVCPPARGTAADGMDGEHGYSCAWAKRPQSPPPPPPPLPPSLAPPPPRPPKPRLFDCFIFGQHESLILNLRIDTTCGIADDIIISQGTTTHSGDAHRPFLDASSIAALRRRCPPEQGTSLHVVLVDTRAPTRSKNRNWAALSTQLTALAIKARQLGMRKHDLVLISEHDEIPSPSFLRQTVHAGGFGSEPHCVTLRTHHHYLYRPSCLGGSSWDAGFVANGATLDLIVDPEPKLWVRRYPGATPILPPGARTPYVAEAASSESDGLRPLRVDPPNQLSYPFVPPLLLRLTQGRQMHGLHRHREAGRLDPSAQTAGWGTDGFPPPHYASYNASWHLSTFMSPEQVLQKLRSAAHVECNREPFSSLHWQKAAQRRCAHFCNASHAGSDADSARAGARERSRPRPIGQPLSELPADAYPPAICRRDYASFAPRAWCALHHQNKLQKG